jgi:hypothetical protein
MSYVALATVVIGAGTAAYSANQQKKNTAKQAETQRNTGSELSSLALSAPDILELGQQFDAQAGQLQMDVNQASAEDAIKLYGMAGKRERRVTDLQRQADVEAVNRYGPRLQSYLEKLNPGWKLASDRLNTAVSQTGDQSPLLQSMNRDALRTDPNSIASRLYSSAQSDLAQGGNLTADQMRAVQQDSRAAFSARGMLNGDSAAFDEILNLANARQARERERQAFAMNVLGQDRAYGLGVQGANLAQQGQDNGLLLNALQTQQAAMNPVLGIVNARTNVNPAIGAQLLGSGPRVAGQSAGLIGSLLGYGAGANDFNANAAQAANISAANNQAALYGSLINTAGQAYQSYQSRPASTTTTTATPNAGAVSGYSYSPSTGYTATV